MYSKAFYTLEAQILLFNIFAWIAKISGRADEAGVIGINLRTAVGESIVMLSATKHLGTAREILRFAQDDKWME